MRLLFLGTIFTLFCSGCGDSGESDGGALFPDQDVEQVTGPTISDNPIKSTQFFGTNGNLWKPAGDDHGAGAGNLVVLLSAEFTEQFDSCEIVKNTGEISQLRCINDQPWTHIPYSCFSNGDRQTWRADFPCGEAAQVRVTCREEKQEVTFTVGDENLGNLCTRFG